MTRPAGLILAAGASSRMGRPKALLAFGATGRTFVETLVEALAQSGCAPVVVVTGAATFDVPPPARAAHAPDWAFGMRASLRAGLVALGPEAWAGGVLLTHVDRPCVRAETLAVLQAGPPSESRVPHFSGKPGHPVFLGAPLCAALAAPAAPGLAEPRLDALLRAHGARAVPVADPDVLLNVNTPEEWAALTSRLTGGPPT